MDTRRKMVWVAAIAAAAALLAVLLYVDARRERALEWYLERRVGPGEVVISTLSDVSKLERLEGVPVIVTDFVHWDDVVGYRGAWVVSGPSPVIPLIERATVEDVGPYRIHHLDNGEPDPRTWDLIAHLPTAAVQRVDDRLEPCPLRQGIFVCEGEPWFSVTVGRVLMGGEAFTCISAHPRDHSRLDIVYPTTPGGRVLSLRGGIDDGGVHDPEGTDVEVTASSGGRELGSLVFENVPGVQRRRVVLSPTLHGPAPLVLTITARRQDTRHFCFTGELVK
jgi:hypothetical protein